MEIKYFLYEITKISLVALIAYTSYYYYKYFTRENPLPGPFPFPLIGNLHQLFKNFTLDAKQLVKYGDLCEFYIGSRRLIYLANDDLIQKMMRPIINGPFHNRINEDHEIYKDISFLKNGLLLNSNYNEWHYHRKFFTKVTMSPSFIKQSVIAVQNSFLEMEKYWEKLGEDTVLEFNCWWKRYYLDTIFVMTTNKPAYALANYYNKVTPNEKLSLPESILKESDMLVETIDAFVLGLGYFLFVPKIIQNFPGINRYTQYFKERTSWLENTMLNTIKLKREEIDKTPIDQKLKSDMLTMYLTVNTERDITERIADDLHDKPMPDKNIAANFVEVIVGGIDTIANSTCFLINFLENYPKVKQQMIEEIERVLGKDPNSLFTSEDLSKLEYVEAIIKEASRINSLTPLSLKKNSVPEVIGGYKWSKDTNFVINIDRIQKHELYWKDPEIFNPDRFMDKNNPDSKKQVYMFGGGLRKCPGRNLAMMEIKVALAMLYRKYDIQLMGPMKESTGTIKECDELKVKLKKKKNL